MPSSMQRHKSVSPIEVGYSRVAITWSNAGMVGHSPAILVVLNCHWYSTGPSSAFILCYTTISLLCWWEVTFVLPMLLELNLLSGTEPATFSSTDWRLKQPSPRTNHLSLIFYLIWIYSQFTILDNPGLADSPFCLVFSPAYLWHAL